MVIRCGPNEIGNFRGDNVGRLPSFFVIGPPRTGTSWLHSVLGQSAWLSSPTKETRFFDRHFHRGLDWYASHYRKAGVERPIGEVAPTYFASCEARDRIAKLIPRARVICTFRDPVDRILSLYRLKRAYGLIPWNFEQALASDPELLATSRYAEHLKSWQTALGSRQVLPTIFDDMQSDPQSYLDSLADFAGLSRVALGPSQRRCVLASDGMTEPRNYFLTRSAALLADWSRARRLDSLVARAKDLGALKLFIGGGPVFAELTLPERMRLYESFRPEVDKLEVMLNRDLSAWKHPRRDHPAVPLASTA
jgi:Sulfotransferase domain